MAAGRIDGIIARLAEHRFIERTGEDPTVAKQLAENEAVEIDEDWDDEKPLWAQSAESIEGVGLQEIVENETSTQETCSDWISNRWGTVNSTVR